MKSFVKYINENQALNEFANKINEEMILESFQSSLLSKLAHKIKTASNQKSNRKVSFTSIFGPINKLDYHHRPTKEKVFGIKWDQITDDDFIKYDGYSKELKKILQNVYKKTENADFIVCDGDDIVYFIKGYNGDVELYSFDGHLNTVKKETRRHYSYQERNLKLDEVLVLIHDFDEIYVLKITEDMVKEYISFNKERLENQKGIINYDEKSLKDIAERQRYRYQTLAKEMRANKIDDDKLFNDIKDVNKEVVDLYEKIMKNPDFMDKYYELGRLMSYVGSTYDKFYMYSKEKAKVKKMENHLKDEGKSQEEIDNRTKYYKSTAKEYSETVIEYIKEIKKSIDQIENDLKGAS